MKSNRLSFFWRISAIFFVLLLLIGIGYMFITSFFSAKYFQEVNQKLYGETAAHLVHETNPLKKGEVDTAATHLIMHSMMIINPSVEVYLLDPKGNIIDYVVPHQTVKLDKVDLSPVESFVKNKGEEFILGDDPKNPNERNVFSAAPILENNELVGYAYIILAGEEHGSVIASLRNSFMLKLGATSFFLALIGTFLIGLLALWFLTKNLREIIHVVKRFKEGDMDVRIRKKTKDDFGLLSETFNEMADTLVDNIDRIKSNERLRRELIANVSHDLRTPISIMQGYVETLIMKDDKVSGEERIKYLQIVMDSSQKLSHLVSQLFEYSKLESNQIKPQKEMFFINELMNDILAKYFILAEEKKIRLRLEAKNDLPMVFADIALVERVVQNLLDNALKFTPEHGQIVIYLENKENGVEVRVTDNGNGIPLEDQPYIFERYHQSNMEKRARNLGAGLGLSIVKKIMELHNETVYMRSTPNVETSFWFKLPAELQAA